VANKLESFISSVSF